MIGAWKGSQDKLEEKKENVSQNYTACAVEPVRDRSRGAGRLRARPDPRPNGRAADGRAATHKGTTTHCGAATHYRATTHYGGYRTGSCGWQGSSRHRASDQERTPLD